MIGADTSWIARMLADEQERAAKIRVVALYAPIALSTVAYFLRGRRIRTFASPLLSLMWASSTLLILQRLNMHYGWWSFDTRTACLLGMPVALYLGWAIFWGLLPQFAWPKLRHPLNRDCCLQLRFSRHDLSFARTRSESSCFR